MKTVRNQFFKIIFVALFFCQSSFSNTLFGGIEIGSKGVKVTILDVENAKKNLFVLKEFWTNNVGIARGISIDGNLAQEDIEAANRIVVENYLKLLNQYKIEDKNIFIVASSGVGMAKNTSILVALIKQSTKKDMEVISSKLEAKLLFRGSITKNRYQNSLVLDIGGGNTKGGFVEEKNDEFNVFYPFNLNFGTITLTEKINKKLRDENSLSEYTNKLFDHNPELEAEIKKMYNEFPEFRKRKNLYMSGGAVWAFYTLFNNLAFDNFTEFTYENVQEYDSFLKNNFSKFTEMAKTDEEVAKVLKTYSQRHLMAANTILMLSLENLGDLKSKKIYFVKQGQIAWLLSYVADTAKGAKPIY